jgi:hypothetical protein
LIKLHHQNNEKLNKSNKTNPNKKPGRAEEEERLNKSRATDEPDDDEDTENGNSDDEYETEFECNDEDFKCNNNKQCINSAKRCNGVPDCHDNSDEVGCNSNGSDDDYKGECFDVFLLSVDLCDNTLNNKKTKKLIRQMCI